MSDSVEHAFQPAVDAQPGADGRQDDVGRREEIEARRSQQRVDAGIDPQGAFGQVGAEAIDRQVPVVPRQATVERADGRLPVAPPDPHRAGQVQRSGGLASSGGEIEREVVRLNSRICPRVVP